MIGIISYSLEGYLCVVALWSLRGLVVKTQNMNMIYCRRLCMYVIMSIILTFYLYTMLHHPSSVCVSLCVRGWFVPLKCF